MEETIYVVVPFYNEEKIISTLVESLKQQEDQKFHVIYVDNNSNDTTVEVLHKSHHNALFTYEIITEKEKGTGSASDTGFRYAIDTHNAQYIARTDADCLVHENWVKQVRQHLAMEGLDFVAGIIKPRSDDIPLTRKDKMVIPMLIFISEWYAKLFKGIRGYKYIFFLVAGNNLAITQHMYKLSGGFPRTSIDTTDEDLVLAQSIRKITTNAKQSKHMVVYNSTRRLKTFGWWNILMWYKDRSYKPPVIDIR